MMTATETMRPLLAHLHVGRVEPQIGPVALDRAIEEGFDTLVDLLAQARDLALRDAAHAERLHKIVDRARRDALDVGLLHHRGQRLLGEPPRLEEAREVRALAQLRDAQLDGPGPGLPDPVAVAVALRQTLRALLAVSRARQPADLERHQPLGRKADHLAQKIGLGGLLHERAQVHHRLGHRRILDQVECRNPTLPGHRR
jgi:hypothetical protein